MFARYATKDAIDGKKTIFPGLEAAITIRAVNAGTHLEILRNLLFSSMLSREKIFSVIANPSVEGGAPQAALPPAPRPSLLRYTIGVYGK